MENVVEGQQRWRVEFGTSPPTRITITIIRDKIEVDGTVHDVLKGRCGRKRRGSATEFLPRSPDLTTLDLWATLKNTVYATKPQALEELRDQIERAINDTPLATSQTVCRSVRLRCWECTVAECGHFEHVRVYGSLRNRIQNKLYFCLISLPRNNVSKSAYINLRHFVYIRY